MKNERFSLVRDAALAIVTGLVCGPVMSLLSAETVLLAHGHLPVPVWDRWSVGLFLVSSFFLAFLLPVTIAVTWWRRTLSITLVRLTLLAAFLTCFALSLALSLGSVVNARYERYVAVPLHSTVWATNYSDTEFAKLGSGMKAAEIVKRVGDPMRKFDTDSGEVWVYSDIGHYRNLGEKGYHQRWLLMADGTAVHLWRRYLTAEHVLLSGPNP